MKKEVSKKMTIEDLALIMGKAFNALDGKFEVIDRRFDAIDKRLDMIESRLDAIEKRLDSAEKHLESVEDQLQKVRNDILRIGDTFPSMYQFDELALRVAKLEAQANKTKKIKS